MNSKYKKHCIIECIPVTREDAKVAPVYFEKAIQESESEWSQHRKLINTSGKGIRRSIPPNMAYFYVQFGMANGFAHHIENTNKFPRFFGRETVAGILRLDPEKYIIKPKRRTFDEERKIVLGFLDWYKDYDWTLQEFPDE
jgi:hypothetical protein